MPLPTNTTKMPWPPPDFTAIVQDMQMADAWYSGDPDKLMAYYGGAPSAALGKQDNSFERSFGVSFRGGISFWSRRSNDPGNRGVPRIHVPVAADIASRSTDFLFGESPTIQIPEAHEQKAVEGAVDTEARLQELMELLQIEALLTEAADFASGIGGVYLVPGWDQEIGQHPILRVVSGDCAIPEFRYGYLSAVTFYRTVKTDKRKVWRHLEKHEPGHIYHGLYEGDKDVLGDLVMLDTLKETAGFSEDVKLPDGITGLMVSYIPNALPNRKRRMRVGRSDTAGAESMMDALDETWTSWMRDIRLGQAKVFVPNDWLKRTERGGGAQFDHDQDVFVRLDVDPLSKEAMNITPNQFAIRYEEHRGTYLELFEQIIHAAGYSPQSFGLHIEGQAESGTALKLREGASYRTTMKKRRFFEPAVAAALEKMLIIDQQVFGSSIVPFRPRVVCNEAESDQMQTAQTVQLLRTAGAMSIRNLVKMAQPHLEGEELDAEVQRCMQEQGMLLPDPTANV
ncbi:MAG: phage portal protein [Actinobacteria bacterium]|nr:phage portal protein [Actinomycetota bacterium]